MATGLKFGSVGRSSRYSVNQSADRLELRDGFQTEMYMRRRNDTREETVEKLLSFGIEDSATNPFGRVLTTVSMVESEDTIEHESWVEGREPNQVEATQGGPLVLIDAMLYTRKEIRWTVAGIGEIPEVVAGTAWKVGDYVDADIVIDAASTGADPDEIANVTILAGAFLESLTADGENTNWSTFSMTFVSYEAQAPGNPLTPLVTVASADMLNPDVQWAGVGAPADGYWTKSTRTTTLTSEGWATITTSVELHEKHPDYVTGIVTP